MLKYEPTFEEKELEKMYRYEYAMYEMLSSYFKKSTCTSLQLEKRLKLSFCDVSSSKQADMEDIVLDCIDNFILAKMKVKNIEEKEVEVKFLPQKDSKLHVLVFKGEGFIFAFTLSARYNKEQKKEYLYLNILKNEVVENKA